jgi:hypothetical protein
MNVRGASVASSDLRSTAGDSSSQSKKLVGGSTERRQLTTSRGPFGRVLVASSPRRGLPPPEHFLRPTLRLMASGGSRRRLSPGLFCLERVQDLEELAPERRPVSVASPGMERVGERRSHLVCVTRLSDGTRSQRRDGATGGAAQRPGDSQTRRGRVTVRPHAH